MTAENKTTGVLLWISFILVRATTFILTLKNDPDLDIIENVLMVGSLVAETVSVIVNILVILVS